MEVEADFEAVEERRSIPTRSCCDTLSTDAIGRKAKWLDLAGVELELPPMGEAT